jgi:hypothetical protein
LDTIELTNTVIRLLRSYEADIVELQRLSPTLTMVAAKKGEALYERNGARQIRPRLSGAKWLISRFPRNAGIRPSAW